MHYRNTNIMTKGLIFILGVILFTSCDKNEYSNISQLPNGYVAKYSLNGNANDDSKYQNDGKIVGKVTSTVDRNGHKNSAMFFDNEISYIDIGDVEELKLTTAITISVWVKADSLQTGWNTIVNKWKHDNEFGGSGYFLGITPYSFNLRWNVTNHIVQMDTPFPLNTWTHIVVTYDRVDLMMYLNGELVGRYPFEGEIIDNDAPFRIGHQSEIFSGEGNFHGGIDDVIIYDRAINENEIDQLYMAN